MNTTQIEAIEKDRANASALVNLGTSLDRLKKNKDFNVLISKGYFEQEAIRLVHLKAAPSMQSDESQKYIIGQIDAIGAFRAYLDTIFARANMAQKVVEDAADELAEIYAGDEE